VTAGPSAEPDLRVDFLIAGAGMSGLGFASFLGAEAKARGRPTPSLLVLEAADEPGGYCRTVRKEGFVWDYSGHFFHFAHPEIEAWLRARMPGRDVRTVERKAKIRYRGRDLDFPFQANIHQLAQDDFIDCLVELHAASRAAAASPAGAPPPRSFKQMLYQRLGRGIAERFLIPYNEKLYACDLDELDPDAMGRFFPRADLDSVIANMRPDPARRHAAHGYNATFTYPAGGAIEYVHALLGDLPPGALYLGERLVRVDLERKLAVTSRERTIAYAHLISSAPLPALLAACEGEAAAAIPDGTFTANSVLVYNLGFDRKGRRDVHWMYFPDRERVFYRAGWYDNILDGDRMSLYIEIGAPQGAKLPVEPTLAKVLEDLRAEGLVTDHQLVAWHHVVLDPAYVHITGASLKATAAARARLAAADVHSVGRYGGWTYCSIEDNLLETRALAAQLAAAVFAD
jgi:protoporphyrinogen oxidase